ncbi:mono/diheme cytochrome c family protein [Litoreibacter halocynthiae]|uniref:Mono/diheme cytochrome c family protein n=1 Tax=Litoreibacter halocynthiae TaxID=1242689 RepID=A0A4R7LCD1_9RHOB|nr:c-type cytochrome [Litoreibacter halocynthiae]TDT72709.1 mono/diheme cytochrome c family protein [Litoreibacter halocynthiae]
MRHRLAYGGLAALVLAAGSAIVWANSHADLPIAADFPIDIAKGESLYLESCASCHGANLEGQEDWQSPGDDGKLKAPPHDETGHTWHHPDSLLFTYTKLGGKETLAAQGMEFNSGMPGFGNQLSNPEIWSIIAYIKSTWPERARMVQAERTAADDGS